MKNFKIILVLLISSNAFGQISSNTQFEQLGTTLPTPNSYRMADGSPGPKYFQNRADYQIFAELDDKNQRLTGSETITYHNNSPQTLSYLWVQLDMNMFQKNSINALSKTGGISEKMSASELTNLDSPNSVFGNVSNGKELGYNIRSVKTVDGQDLHHVINSTMMRVDLPSPLKTNETYSFKIEWDFNILPYYGRSGYEYFAEDGNYNYFMAHWFPRLCVYDDVNGWQNKQFMGRGEFALPFGNYHVEISVPNDHVVGATGVCKNWDQVLNPTEQARIKQAQTATKPVIIVTQSEAIAKSKKKSTKNQTWIYDAENVRDFAFASSRRFIWDAMQTDVYGDGNKIWSMSFYPKEGNPLWEQYSTRVVEHTLKTYGEYTVKYPYPTAISCHATAGGGMEYPMISFNGGRPEADGTYSENVKNGMISVIIHEVGHNFFPMIINSDERQWTWMDEGLNSFVQSLSEKYWDRDYKSRRGEPQKIVPYMSMDPSKLSPIMTNSENILNFGPNAYSKPATALNILRETVMGRELFDYAFKEYSKRWAFKHPSPADFFRTMEDASGVDLDWFWKGWFYSVMPVDQTLVDVQWYQADSQNPEVDKAEKRQEAEAMEKTMTNINNKKDIKQTVVEADPSMRDFYNSYDPFKATEKEKKAYQEYLASLSPEEKALVQGGMNYYQLNLKNTGGLVMPVIIQLVFEDGTTEDLRYPAEIWRYNDKTFAKTIATEKKVKKFILDPYYEIADINTKDNVFPREPDAPTKFEIIKNQSRQRALNPMQEAASPASIQSSGRK